MGALLSGFCAAGDVCGLPGASVIICIYEMVIIKLLKGLNERIYVQLEEYPGQSKKLKK